MRVRFDGGGQTTPVRQRAPLDGSRGHSPSGRQAHRSAPSSWCSIHPGLASLHPAGWNCVRYRWVERPPDRRSLSLVPRSTMRLDCRAQGNIAPAPHPQLPARWRDRPKADRLAHRCECHPSPHPVLREDADFDVLARHRGQQIEQPQMMGSPLHPDCPQADDLRPCGGVRAKGDCEVVEGQPCVFLERPLPLWPEAAKASPSPGMGMADGRPFVITDLHVLPRHLSSLRDVARRLKGTCDAVLVRRPRRGEE